MYFMRYQQKLVTFVIYDNTHITVTHNYLLQLEQSINYTFTTQFDRCVPQCIILLLLK